VLILQSTFCVNSLAHWVGDYTYTDEHSPVDNWFVSLLTFGEGYHNFHHEFPYGTIHCTILRYPYLTNFCLPDFRNGVKWYSFDPSKWTIWLLSLFGLTYNLKRFPMNEIRKGELQMLQKRIEREKAKLSWGRKLEELPAYTMQEVQLQSASHITHLD